MSKDSIIGGVVILVIIFGIGFYFFNKPSIEEEQKATITENFWINNKVNQETAQNINLTIYKDNNFIKTTTFSNTWVGLDLKENSNYFFLLEGKDYYSTLYNISSKIENRKLDITPQGKLLAETSKSNNQIDLKLTGVGQVNNLNICYLHSLGYLEVIIPQDNPYCNTNWSKISNDIYLCGEQTEHCSGLQSNTSICILENRVPNRYKNLVNNCVNIGKSLNHNSITIPIQVRTNSLTETDYLKFYVIDEDLVYRDGEFYYDFEKDGQDNGIGDLEV